jgi:hypothetical protein
MEMQVIVCWSNKLEEFRRSNGKSVLNLPSRIRTV